MKTMNKKKRKKTLKILIIVLVILIILFFGLSLWLASFVMTGTRQTLDEAMTWQSEHYDTSFYDGLDKTDYTVKGYEDYILNVEFLKNPSETDRYIIISHGYTDNRIGSLKYARMYLELGFNCIIYDLRGHGLNEKTFTTYGVLEARDLICLINDTKSRYHDISLLGLHGESLGAATTITSLKYKPDVDFVVADCGFSDIENVLRAGYRNAHAPVFLVDVASFGAVIRYHYSLKKMRPIDSLVDNEIPIMFIHGENDTFISPENSVNMSKKTKGFSRLHIVPGAEHAESILKESDEYKKFVEEFLEEI